MAHKNKELLVDQVQKILADKFTGPNGKSIFFPADGYTWKGGPVKYDGDEGDIWTKTPSVNYSATDAYYLYFDAGIVTPLSSCSRALGFPVRPVR